MWSRAIIRLINCVCNNTNTKQLMNYNKNLNFLLYGLYNITKLILNLNLHVEMLIMHKCNNIQDYRI